MGPKTQSAITSYQKSEGMKVTGRLDDDTATKLGVASKTSETAPSASPAAPSSPSEQTPPVKRQTP